MFIVKASHSETVKVRAGITPVRTYFTDISNFIDLMPNVESIRTDHDGVTHWEISATVPFVGTFIEHFPVMRIEDSDERVEWSPHAEEELNLLSFAADFNIHSTSSTEVRFTQVLELRRRAATDLHIFAGFAGAPLISMKAVRRVPGNRQNSFSVGTIPFQALFMPHSAVPFLVHR